MQHHLSMWATMDVPSGGIHTWDMAQVTKIMAQTMVTVANIRNKHRNIIYYIIFSRKVILFNKYLHLYPLLEYLHHQQ